MGFGYFPGFLKRRHLTKCRLFVDVFTSKWDTYGLNLGAGQRKHYLWVFIYCLFQIVLLFSHMGHRSVQWIRCDYCKENHHTWL